MIKPSLLALSLLSLGLVACDKQEERIVVSKPTLATPTTSAETVTITAESLKAEGVALSLSWAKAQFGSDFVSPVYEVLALPSGSNAEPKVFPVPTAKLALDFTTKQLNELVLEDFQFPAGTATSFDFWLRAYPTGAKDLATAPVATSSVAKVNLTAIQLEEPIIAPAEYVVEPYYFLGNMFEASHEWKNDYAGYPLFKASPTADESTYTGYFKAGAEFKFTNNQALGSWENILGATDATTLTLQGGDTNIKRANAGGYFMLKMNPKTLTYSLTPMAGTSMESDFTQIGVIGTAFGGWDADKVVLKQTTYDKHIWTAKRVKVMAGEFKFRANNAWDISWGGNGLFPAGKATAGDNIKIEAKQAGTYDIFFNDLTQHFIFLPTRK